MGSPWPGTFQRCGAISFIGVSDGRVQARQSPEIIRGMTN